MSSTEDYADYDVDPITLEPFSEMSDFEIIAISDHKFYLPTIYDWVFNKGFNTNPYTNLAFTHEELSHIQSSAKTNYPLNIIYNTITGFIPTYKTTSLVSCSNLLMSILTHGANSPTETLYQAFKSLANENIRLSIKFGEKLYSEYSLIKECEDMNILQLTKDSSIRVFLIQYTPPPQRMSTIQNYIELALEKDWPVETFTAHYDISRYYILRAEAQDRRNREIMERYDEKHGDIQDHHDENKHKIGIGNLLPDGRSFYVYPEHGARFTDLKPLIVEQLEGVMKIDVNLMRFIYGGHVYHDNVLLSSLPDFEEEMLIQIAFRSNYLY
jgi:hypothetical protein